MVMSVFWLTMWAALSVVIWFAIDFSLWISLPLAIVLAALALIPIDWARAKFKKFLYSRTSTSS